MGGILALVKQPRIFFRDDQLANPRFKSITIVDDGVSNNLFETLQRSLAGNVSIKIARRNATNQNAFAGISSASDDVYIETIPYSVTGKPSVHGRAVVTYIKLGQNSIVDFDDADTKAIAKVVEALKARGVTSITSFVVPHHGSKYHDVEPILTLNPRYAVIAVNPENRYGHPSPTILLKLMQKLGKKNVVFTGSVENVVLDQTGIKYALFTAAQRDSYALFVAPNRIRAEKKGIQEDIQATKEIKKMMDEEGVDLPRPMDGSSQNPRPRIKSGGPARNLIEQIVLLNGSILQPDFEYGAVSFGSDGPSALRGHRVFANPTGSTGDMTGRDIAVVVERADNDSTEQRTA